MKIKIKDKNLYYVGGFVRDELIGIPSFDLDFCYEGDAIEFSKEFNVVKVNPDFGTVRINLDGDSVDIASTRTEYYPRPGHLPVVNQIGCSLKEDLARRDFTINAICYDLNNNKIIDLFNGIEHIQQKKIVEIKEHPYFIAAQFHPELKSRPNNPAPLFAGLIKAAKNV